MNIATPLVSDVSSTLSDTYSDRIRSPSQTLQAIEPFLPEFGITRLARQTGLDNIGIPVWAAFRPNSRSITVNQGKGIGDEWAKASAAMEAIECAVAENPSSKAVCATQLELEACGRSIFDPQRLLPNNSIVPKDAPFEWLCGEELASGKPVYVHRTVCCLDGAPALSGLCQNSNGLASGNSIAEALFHGLCELVERDAVSLWAFTESEERLRRCISPASFRDPVVSALSRAVSDSGADLRLFLLTSDVGVCTVSAVIRRHAGREDLFNYAAGSGCHPVPGRAAVRAITEAVQSRISAIAATRDDISPSDYRKRTTPEIEALFEAPERTAAVSGLELGTPLTELLGHTVNQLADRGCEDVIGVELTSADLPFAVVRLLSRSLEDWDVNANWRPGPRLLAALA